MIDYAYKYKNEIEEIWPNLLNRDKYTFYLESPVMRYGPDIQLYSDNKLKSQMVSLSYDSKLQNWLLNGFLEAELDWISRKVTNLSYASFANDVSPTMAKDIFRFINKLFNDDNIRKISLNAMEESPYFDFTRKLVMNYGGRKVGTLKKEAEINGDYYDMVLFEILNEDWKGNFIDE